MPDQSNFEHVLETDIVRLAAEIKNQRERVEMRDAAEREIVKEALRSFTGTSAPPRAPATGSAAGTADDDASPLPDYAKAAPAEVKLEIESLLEIALREGLSKALTESRRTPYFVQDAFHDALIGKLYPELQKQGIVK